MAQSTKRSFSLAMTLLLAFCSSTFAAPDFDPGTLSMDDDVKAVQEKFEKQMEELRGELSRQLKSRTEAFDQQVNRIREMAAEELDKTRTEARAQLEMLQNRAAEELTSIGVQFETQLKELKAIADDKLAMAQAEIERLIRENESLKSIVNELREMTASSVSGGSVAKAVEEPAVVKDMDNSRPRARLGLSILPGDADVESWSETSANLVTIVSEVTAGGSAEKIGLKSGDVILRVDGEPASIENMQRIVGSKKVGDEIVMTWARRGSDGVLRTQVRGILGDHESGDPRVELPSGGSQVIPEAGGLKPVADDKPGVSLGVSVVQEEGFGIRLTEVDPGSNAAVMGLAAGDVITGTGETQIRTIEGLRDILMRTVPGSAIEIRFQREGRAWIAKGVLASSQGEARRESLERASKLRGFLGIVPAESEGGLVIQEVIEGSSAAQMGLLSGDRLVSVGGKTVSDLTAMRESLKDLREGDSLVIRFSRDGQAMERRGTLGAFPDDQSSRSSASPQRVVKRAPQPRLSSEIKTATASIPEPGEPTLGIAVVWSESGVTIERVFPGSLAEEAGLEMGDRLIRIENTSIDSLVAIQSALENREEYGVVFEVERGLDQVVLMTRPREAVVALPEVTSTTPAAAVIPQEAPVLGLDIEENSWGILVLGTVEGLPAHEGGLRAGDWILSVCDSEVETIEDMQTALQYQGLDLISMTVRRGVEEIEISLPLLLP